MDSCSNMNTLKVSYEYSYLRVLESIFQDIKVEISEQSETVLVNTEGKTVKGPGKAVGWFLQRHAVEEATLKRVSEIVSLRPQQMIAYEPEDRNNDVDVILAISKIRKWIAEGYLCTKISENVLEKLCVIHDKHQEIFCRVTQEKLIPPEKFRSIMEFYKAVVCTGTIDSIIDHPEADSLYIENVDFGKEKRTVVSGLKGKFEKARLVNQTCLFMTNLKPTAFKGTKSFGMILFAKDTATGSGSVVFASPKGARLSLADHPLESLVPFPVKVGDCSKKTLETFFSLLCVKENLLMYNGMPTAVEKKLVNISEVSDGTVS